MTVEPATDDQGKPDPCSSIITLHVWLDGASSLANGCMPNPFTPRKDDLWDEIDLEAELAEARKLLEGKRFACPCKKPPGKKCWIEFRIKVHRQQRGDEPGGATPVPVELDCRCPKHDIAPAPPPQWAYKSPGEFQHPPTNRFRVCHPVLPTAPHTMAHEVMHALGLGVGTDMYDDKGQPLDGWEGTLMGDPHGTDVTQRDICMIAKANRACRTRSKGKKDVVCCDGHEEAILDHEGKAIRAEESAIAAVSGLGTHGAFFVQMARELVTAAASIVNRAQDVGAWFDAQPA